MKNFILISPHFPDSYYHFAEALKRNGFNVLGIGDAPYAEIPLPLKESLAEYYVCNGMDNFENEVNAVRYFEQKYGHIDYLESNNEYWLGKDAKLREIFNIEGAKPSDLEFYQHKSLMKQKYQKAGCHTARYILVTDKEKLLEFISEVGYPVFIKPDIGVGASGDYKIKDIKDVENFFSEKQENVTYICEQFVFGNIVSFDGVCDDDSNVVFCTSNEFPPSIADIVNGKTDFMYYTVPHISEDLETIGRAVIKAFGVKKRFFHLEFFRLTKDICGLGKKGDIIPLETNMRPAGGYTPDMINYANSVNCYQIYADIMAFNENRVADIYPHYYCVCSSRRDTNTYVYADDSILERYKDEICQHGRYADVLSGAMGNRYFMAKFNTIEQVLTFNENISKRRYVNLEKRQKSRFGMTGEDIEMFHEREQEKPEKTETICDINIDGA